MTGIPTLNLGFVGGGVDPTIRHWTTCSEQLELVVLVDRCAVG